MQEVKSKSSCKEKWYKKVTWWDDDSSCIKIQRYFSLSFSSEFISLACHLWSFLSQKNPTTITLPSPFYLDWLIVIVSEWCWFGLFGSKLYIFWWYLFSSRSRLVPVVIIPHLLLHRHCLYINYIAAALYSPAFHYLFPPSSLLKIFVHLQQVRWSKKTYKQGTSLLLGFFLGRLLTCDGITMMTAKRARDAVFCFRFGFWSLWLFFIGNPVVRG